MVNKKIITIFLLITIILSAGTFFYWKNQQKELLDINSSLPEGIKAIKTIFGNYKIINKIDDYSFETPKIWEGIEYVEYVPEETRESYIISSINLEGTTLDCRLIAINRFKTDNPNLELKGWATTAFNDFGLSSDFQNYKVGDIDAVITRENPDLVNMDVYFFKKGLIIYSVMGGSKDFIEEIILNGEW